MTAGTFGSALVRLDDEATTLGAAAALLQILRDNSIEYGQQRRNIPRPSRVRAATREVGKLFHASRLDAMPESVTDKLRKWRTDFGDLQDLVAIRCVAEAIDTQCGSSFLTQSKDYYSASWADDGALLGRPLRAGDPVPVASGFIDQLRASGIDLTTDPYNLPSGQQGDRLRRLVLANGNVEKLTVRLDFTLRRELEQFAESDNELKVAICLPTSQFARHYTAEYDWDRETFFPVSPANKGHLDRMKRCLRTAADRGAQIVVFPELSGTDEMHHELRNSWLALAGETRPRLLAVGSSHTVGGNDDRMNVARLAVHADVLRDGGRSASSTSFFDAHRKAVPYVERRPPDAPGNRSRPGPMFEDITHSPHPELRIFVGQQFMLFTIVVCIDFLDGRVRDVLRDLHVDLVLLPAMSRKTRVFEDLMAGHVAATQATVVLANALVGESATHALISHPCGEQRVTRIDETWKTEHDQQSSSTSLRNRPGVAVLPLQRIAERSAGEWVSV